MYEGIDTHSKDDLRKTCDSQMRNHHSWDSDRQGIRGIESQPRWIMEEHRLNAKFDGRHKCRCINTRIGPNGQGHHIGKSSFKQRVKTIAHQRHEDSHIKDISP